MASEQAGDKPSAATAVPGERLAQVRRLRAIPEPRTMPQLLFAAPTLPLVSGEDGDDWLCGRCPALLAKSARKEQFEAGVLRCPECGTYNVFP